MLDKLLTTLRQYDMIQRGDTVICAVSGGADSMAMLFALYLLRDKLEISLKAAHFNHNLRGAESDGDEAFVRDFCQRYDVELFVGTAQVTAGEKGLEAAARDARYGFFQSLSGKIATAHTADDNAETVLMRLLRGTGLKGLGAIAPVRGNIIRPLLDVTRQEVLAFLAEYHIQFRQDSSNAGDDFLRNRLRHHVIPLLKEENPRLAENLSAMAQRLRQDEKTLSDLAKPTTEVAALRAMAPAIRSRSLERILKDAGVREPEAAHIRLLESVVLSENPSAKARFSGGIVLGRQYGTIVKLQADPVPEPVVLPCPGQVRFGAYRITCLSASSGDGGLLLGSEGPITIRSRQAGDKIRLSGGTKTLKKLFIDRKIPASLREFVPVFADRRGVLGVWGIGADIEKNNTNLSQWRILVEERG